MITANEIPSFEKMLRENRQENKPIQKGYSEENIRLLMAHAKVNLKMGLPVEYLDFLRRIDGYSDFGLMLYASSTKQTGNDNWIYGVIDMNEDYHLFFPAMVVLGESGDDLFVFDAIDRCYSIIDRACPTNIHATFKRFWAMVEEVAYPLINDPVEDEDEPI